ncbi:putative fibroblast growth factor 7 [Monocercomonoides exilis]|uniref:putative fibroblast growth factor 7 n=1 Tax=Monocercomonoides exilis TaxID=2049356 RepID=UPI0035596931|nr:putative fibroblast growth factor 7 [Monocercomonoides exilis]
MSKKDERKELLLGTDRAEIEQSSEGVRQILRTVPENSEFADLKLPLFPFKERQICSNCKRSSLMFCPNCMLPFSQYPPPQLKLPLELNIVHHPKEKKAKSTAVHAKIVCPAQTTIWEFPDFPTFNPNETLCVFPSDEAKSLTELDLSNFTKVVFIDSTWHQTHSMCLDPRIASLTKVRLNKHKTLFWRYQKESEDFLATIEAIYFFFKEFHMAQHDGKYDGEFDNLLFYYIFQYEHIQTLYENDEQKHLSKHLDPSYYRSRAKEKISKLTDEELKTVDTKITKKLEKKEDDEYFTPTENKLLIKNMNASKERKIDLSST